MKIVTYTCCFIRVLNLASRLEGLKLFERRLLWRTVGTIRKGVTEKQKQINGE